MLKKIKTIDEYLEVYKQYEQKLDEVSKRNDMIIFDIFSNFFNDLKAEYPEFEEKRKKFYNSKF